MEEGSVSKKQKENDKKYLYIVDYWVEFPSSEYGGCVLIIAADDEDCFNIMMEENHKNSGRWFKTPERVERCHKNIADALKFELKEDLPSRIVSEFIT